jgi:hypothetical protein
MKITTVALASLFAISCTFALAQSGRGGGGSGAGGEANAAGSGTGGGTATSSGMTGNKPSNGRTMGSPGPNTSNALNHGTTGNNLGPPGTSPNPSASSEPSFTSKTANDANSKLENTNPGILKK